MSYPVDEVPSTTPPNRLPVVWVGLYLEPPQQRRWTVLLRFFLALPLFFAGVGIAVAAAIWVIGTWFSALFTRRVPVGLHRKLLGVLRFQTRLSAYLALLTDTWPGVHFDPQPDDPITLNVEQVELRRSAVFFRLLLAIPASIVSSLLTSGQVLLVVVMWIVGLVRGRTPTTLHQSVALALRFSTRMSAFMLLLTPAQPFRGAFGDTESVNLPRSDQPSAAAPEIDAVSVPAPAAPDPRPEPAQQTLPTRWVVRRAVKVWLIVILVLGLGGQIGQRASGTGVWTVFRAINDRTVVVTSFNSTTTVIVNFSRAADSCTSTACLQVQASHAASQEATVIRTFNANYTPVATADAQYVAYRDQLLVVDGIFVELSHSNQSLTSDRALVSTLLTNYLKLGTTGTTLENAL